jgi:hypothetical protein
MGREEGGRPARVVLPRRPTQVKVHGSVRIQFLHEQLNDLLLESNSVAG